MANIRISGLATDSDGNIADGDWLVLDGGTTRKINPPLLTADHLDAGTDGNARFVKANALTKVMRWMGAFATNTAKRVGEIFTSGGGIYVVDTAVAANANDTVATLKRIDNPPPMTSAQVTAGTDNLQRTTTAALIKAAIEQHAPEAGVSDDAGEYVRGLVVAVDSGTGDSSTISFLRGVRSASEVSVLNVPYIMDDSGIITSGDPALDATKTNHIVIKTGQSSFEYKAPIRNQVITVISDVTDSDDDQGILGRYIYTGSAWKELVEGKDNSRSRINDFVAGEGSTASGGYSVAMGRNADAVAEGSIAIGIGNHCKKSDSMLVGRNGVLAADFRFAVANSSSAPNSSQESASTNKDVVFGVKDNGDAQMAKVETPHASDNGATATKLRFHALGQSAYDGISNKDSDTLYLITG